MEHKNNTKQQKNKTFEQDYSFLENYIKEFKKNNWKNTVSYKRSYARRLDDDIETEDFTQKLFLVIKACNEQLGMNLSSEEQCEYFDIFANFKDLSVSSFIWQPETKNAEKYELLSSQNRVFTDVNNFDIFCRVFDCLMVGSDVVHKIQRKYTDQLSVPRVVTVTRKDTNNADFIIPDSREGCIGLLRHLIRAHFTDYYYPSKTFTYSCIYLRSKGAPKGFRGKTSVSEYLCQGIADINNLINTRASKGLKLRPIDCLGVMNLVARTVILGNVRQCLPKGTLIHTTKGLVPIEDMTTNHKVVTHEGEHEVTAVMTQGKQRLTCIETEIGHFKCTAEHKMAVWDKNIPSNKNFNRYVWKKAQDLCVTDCLVHITQTIKGDETKIDDIRHSPMLDVNTSYFLGYAHGNAWSCKCILEDIESKTPGSVSFRYNDFFNFFKPEKFKFSLKLNKDDFTIESTSFAKHIHTLRENGQIPHYILQSVTDIRKSYLSGYETAKNIENGVIKNIFNNHFLYNLQSLYSSLGVRTIADTLGHTLKIIDTSYVGQKLIEYFSPVSSVNPIKITNICKIYDKMETYDITVKNTEQFVAGGGILNHNSAQSVIDDCDNIKNLSKESWKCYSRINLDLTQKIDRTNETKYPNLNVTGYNPSLRAGTRVLTSDGIIPIEQLQNRFFKTRNIKGSWSYARCWKSGTDKPLYKITLANGKEYWCTAEHKWPVLDVVENTETNTTSTEPPLTRIKEVTESIQETKSSDKVSMDDLNKSEDKTQEKYRSTVTTEITKTITRTLTTDVKIKDLLPYIKNRALCHPENGVGRYSDGFCIAMLYCSPTTFITKNDETSYVWVLSEKNAKGEYGKLLKTWMNDVDNTTIRTFEKKDNKDNNFVVIIQQSQVFSEHMSKFGLPTEKAVNDKTFGAPLAVWTGSEDFRHGFIDGLYSLVGGVDIKKGLAYIPSESKTFVRDIWDLLGFYGIASTTNNIGETGYNKDIAPLVVFECDIFSQIFYITNKEKQAVLDKLEHRKQNVIGEIEVSSCELTDLKEDVWDVAVYDTEHMFALSHCFTGNCGE